MGAGYALIVSLLAGALGNATASDSNDLRGGNHVAFWTRMPTGNGDVRIDDLFAPYPLIRPLYDPEWFSGMHFQSQNGSRPGDVFVGYRWRNVQVEGEWTNRIDVGKDDFHALPQDGKPFASSVNRLSYRLPSRWTLQVIHGRMNRPEQIDPSDEIRRTSIAAIYQLPFRNNKWQTTMAVGRSPKKEDGKATTAVVFESLIQLHHSHTFFGRYEKAAADELFHDRDTLHGQNFNASRATLGYVYDMPLSGPIKLVVGGLVTKRTIPAYEEAMIGKDPAAYKVFARVSVQAP